MSCCGKLRVTGNPMSMTHPWDKSGRFTYMNGWFFCKYTNRPMGPSWDLVRNLWIQGVSTIAKTLRHQGVSEVHHFVNIEISVCFYGIFWKHRLKLLGPRDPITETEYGIMEPKYFVFWRWLYAPTAHPLTFGDWIPNVWHNRTSVELATLGTTLRRLAEYPGWTLPTAGGTFVFWQHVTDLVLHVSSQKR